MSQDPIITKLNSIEQKLDIIISKFDAFKRAQAQKRPELGNQRLLQAQLEQHELKPFTDRSKYMLARYPGYCRICGKTIELGEPIVFEAGKGAAHETCV